MTLPVKIAGSCGRYTGCVPAKEKRKHHRSAFGGYGNIPLRLEEERKWPYTLKFRQISSGSRFILSR